MATKEGNGSVSSRAKQAAHEAIDQLGAHGEQAEDILRERGFDASDRAQELTEQLTDYIHEHPLTAVGIALAAGFVLGSILRG
ncbi:hypothetical protein CAI21_07670 [Alkalilimnicola ehrlichii]|uniref:DUF883 domain-containing protein n=1 Tax=Alkalilimnicola ehrlichii TaxID=351052 RepID=A0A3E0WX91_9GAMM|nr:DUF883 family protein [Alkalilimnicola ehrlichii]RFA30074.1 hypothetical protein CAI21_07670 [Alkalilimnicola ehrlichii]RFA37418.1 hypothetical protein CAL65_09010 [Alkalilimnicola ehrlichii]